MLRQPAVATLLILTALVFTNCNKATIQIVASHETASVPSDGDSADDVAIWVHPTEPGLGLVIGTDKRAGLSVYDLNGQLVQRLSEGPCNNVDLVSGFMLNGEPTSLLAVSHMRAAQIGFYRVELPSRRVLPVGRVSLEEFRPVGLDLYRSSESGVVYLFATDRKHHLGQWEVRADGHGELELHAVRRFTAGSTIEGCATDESNHKVFFAEEKVGIWCLNAEPDEDWSPVLIDSVGSGQLEADVEGLACVQHQGEGLLVASSQGNDSYAVYRTSPPYEAVGTFRIVSGDGVDGVTHTDGLDVNASGMGVEFPGGLLAVQDDEDDDGNQNFKLVHWEEIIEQLDDRGTLRRPNATVRTPVDAPR